MLMLKCYWAGYLIKNEPISAEAIPERVKELKEEIEEGTLTHTSCNMNLVLEELCIDVMDGDKLIDMHNLKKK